ncbi:MAG: MFS transporter [Chloroflexi bacterium]|nr:MFS transporter [Chloroflexota bacterium]
MPRIPLLVAAVALGNLLVPLNSTMIVVALPQISRDLAADRASVSWLVTAYLIAMAALQPIGGRVGDRFGRRELMQGALVVFAIASIGAALAQSLVILVAFRLIQAAAACAIVPNALGLLRGSIVGDRAGMYFGIAGSMTGLGAAVGPVLGGFLTAIDWRWIFAVNVPIVLLALAAGWRSLPHAEHRRTAPPDVVGALSLGALLALLAWTLIDSEGGLDPPHAGLLLAFVVGTILFVRYESGHADAALPPALFRSRAFTGANLAIALFTGRPTEFALLLVAMPIAGAGVAMNFPATRIAALDSAPEHLMALASGVTSTSRYFGGIAGALLTAIVLGRGDDLSRLPLLFTIFALAGLAAALVGATLPRAIARAT